MGRPLLPMLLAFLVVAACADSGYDNDIVSREIDPVRNWLDGTSTENGSPKPVTTNRSVAPVGQMIDGLARRLQERPDDVDGWRLLAQSYAYVGDMDRARAAADMAVSLGADEASVSAAVRDAHTDRNR